MRGSQTTAVREVQQAKILLGYAAGRGFSAVSREAGVNRWIISKETMAFLDLATRPHRFVYLQAPEHGSWLHLVETLFGKMARTFLRGMRVQSWVELKARIAQRIAEIKQAPIVHRWANFFTFQ